MVRAFRLAAAAALSAGVLLTAMPASAQTPVCTESTGAYPVVTCTAGALSVTVVNVDGDNVTVRISFPDGTFLPFELVVIIVRSEPQNVGTFTANARGGLDATITLPDNLELGTHSISATGKTSGVTAVSTFRVVANGGAGDPDGSAGGGLVNTGSNSTMPLAASGITLVVLGGAMVVVARRSNRSPVVAV